ncbi:uncharacterized protein LOC132556142 [Ylistrum balloti]|uniref:uncharacterized protein LOC132556142 n=1 Tax=Ylistrum balloti TaxID=509963 RepID=UPI00290581B9|nr:uncharacterized protein LOC132556142 [Ylistrum balloti]
MPLTRLLVFATWNRKPSPSESLLRCLHCVKPVTNQEEIHDDKQTLDPIHTDKTSSILKSEAKHEKVFSFLNNVCEKGFQTMKGIESKQSFSDFRSRNDFLKASVVRFERLQYLYTELKKSRPKTAKFCFPALSKKKIEKLKSIVVIDIDTVKSVTWIKVNRQLEVEDWNHAMLIPQMNMFNNVFLYDMAKSAVSKIPSGCIYIIRERDQSRKQKKGFSSMELHYRTLRSIFTTLLKLKAEVEDDPNVYVVNMWTMPEIYKSGGYWSFRDSNCEILQKAKDRKLDGTFVLHMQPNLLAQYNSVEDSNLQEQYASVALLANSFNVLVLRCYDKF